MDVRCACAFVLCNVRGNSHLDMTHGRDNVAWKAQTSQDNHDDLWHGVKSCCSSSQACESVRVVREALAHLNLARVRTCATADTDWPRVQSASDTHLLHVCSQPVGFSRVQSYMFGQAYVIQP